MAIMVLMLCVHAAWAMNWIPGLDGYAQSAQMSTLRDTMEHNADQYKASIQSIESTQSTILVRLIASDLESARANQCKALEDKNAAGAQGWRVKLDASLYEYRVQASRDYPLRPCTEY